MRRINGCSICAKMHPRERAGEVDGRIVAIATGGARITAATSPSSHHAPQDRLDSPADPSVRSVAPQGRARGNAERQLGLGVEILQAPAALQASAQIDVSPRRIRRRRG
jgi:alkylhydroperoxidase family enzyme